MLGLQTTGAWATATRTVASRQARGFGDPRRYPIDWVFCSRRCQDAFHALYGNWQRAKEGRIDKTEVAMIDPSDVELAAMRQCLKVLRRGGGRDRFHQASGATTPKPRRCG
jgi:hypothetical protein